MSGERQAGERRGGGEREFSAGGVVVRGEEVCVIRPLGGRRGRPPVIALPKGHIDPGETAAQAALREVREETGLETEIVEKLGDVRYFYQRDGRRIFKIVTFFLCSYLSGSVEDHDDEIETAWWMPLEAAAQELSYQGEREMAARALAAARAR